MRAEKASLQQIKQEVDRFEAQKTVLQQRIDVIETLQKNRTGGQELLEMVASTVVHVDSIWLTSLNRTGNSIELQGESASINSVANFITQLKRSGYFDNVEIKSAAEDDIVPSVETYNFSMSASIATTPAAAPGAAAPKTQPTGAVQAAPAAGRGGGANHGDQLPRLALATTGSFLCGTRRCADPGGALRSGPTADNIRRNSPTPRRK